MMDGEGVDLAPSHRRAPLVPACADVPPRGTLGGWGSAGPVRGQQAEQGRPQEQGRGRLREQGEAGHHRVVEVLAAAGCIAESPTHAPAADGGQVEEGILIARNAAPGGGRCRPPLPLC